MNNPSKALQAILQGSLSEGVQESGWQPSVDIYRAGTTWLVKFDLAGVRKEDIAVDLDGRRLTVRGIRRDWTILEGQRAYSMEIAYNRFQRAVELPTNVETAQLGIEYRDGMLLVRISPSK